MELSSPPRMGSESKAFGPSRKVKVQWLEESVLQQEPPTIPFGDASPEAEGRGEDWPGLLPLDMSYLRAFVSCISPFCFKYVIFI